MSTYTDQAEAFAKKYGVTLKCTSPEYRKYFADDKEERWVYKCQLKRNGKTYTFNFGQSIANGCVEPEMYDVLACLTKYDPGSLQNFCDDYGYDIDSKKVDKIYASVVREFKAVERLFSDVIDELSEIA
jgi:hypothetical protein